MNGTTTCVRRFINKLPEGAIFTTREIIGAGPRTAIDMALCRLVKSGYIIRLARGVFTVARFVDELPSVLEVARAKAAAFNKKIVVGARHALEHLGLAEPCDDSTVTYITTGSSSSFQYLGRGIRVRFQSACRRKTELGDSFEGVVIRALWSLGRAKATKYELAVALSARTEFEWCGSMPQRASYMPDWMQRLFIWYGHCVNERILPERKKAECLPHRVALTVDMTHEEEKEFWLEYGRMFPDDREW